MELHDRDPRHEQTGDPGQQNISSHLHHVIAGNAVRPEQDQKRSTEPSVRNQYNAVLHGWSYGNPDQRLNHQRNDINLHQQRRHNAALTTRIELEDYPDAHDLRGGH